MSIVGRVNDVWFSERVWFRPPESEWESGEAFPSCCEQLGRHTGVTDALTQVTRYTYDEVGNRLTQAEANGHTTSYAYYQRGRRISRTLPLGQTESYTYDGVRNLQTRTDFNGKPPRMRMTPEIACYRRRRIQVSMRQR